MARRLRFSACCSVPFVSESSNVCSACSKPADEEIETIEDAVLRSPLPLSAELMSVTSPDLVVCDISIEAGEVVARYLRSGSDDLREERISSDELVRWASGVFWSPVFRRTFRDSAGDEEYVQLWERLPFQKIDDDLDPDSVAAMNRVRRDTFLRSVTESTIQLFLCQKLLSPAGS